MIDPFTCDIHFAREESQEELIELKCDEEAEYRYKKGGNYDLWESKPLKSSIMYSEIG